MHTNLVFATTNQGKIREVKSILTGIDFNTLSGMALTCDEPEENGQTFLENAQIKARQYFECLGCPVIADDSGLVVPALGGQPGVHSSRFAGSHATDPENNRFLLESMAGLSGMDRRAYFECVVVYKSSMQETSFSGKCHGSIGHAPKGRNGFGYDPLFYIESYSKTFAELNSDEKNRVSHRAAAFSKLRDFLLRLRVR